MEETLKPQAVKKAGQDWTWGSLIQDLQPMKVFPPSSKLTAYALYDGTEVNAEGAPLT